MSKVLVIELPDDGTGFDDVLRGLTAVLPPEHRVHLAFEGHAAKVLDVFGAPGPPWRAGLADDDIAR